jgi:alanine-glyoxylate transaminase/serine-glyoxylate transaminase/serine-pyruvate transaminase
VRLPSLTLVELPEELAQREAEIRKILLNDFSIEVGAGLGKFAGKYWRIVLMGYNAQPKNVIRLTGALKEIMS